MKCITRVFLRRVENPSRQPSIESHSTSRSLSLSVTHKQASPDSALDSASRSVCTKPSTWHTPHPSRNTTSTNHTHTQTQSSFTEPTAFTLPIPTPRSAIETSGEECCSCCCLASSWGSMRPGLRTRTHLLKPCEPDGVYGTSASTCLAGLPGRPGQALQITQSKVTVEKSACRVTITVYIMNRA